MIDLVNARYNGGSQTDIVRYQLSPSDALVKLFNADLAWNGEMAQQPTPTRLVMRTGVPFSGYELNSYKGTELEMAPLIKAAEIFTLLRFQKRHTLMAETIASLPQTPSGGYKPSVVANAASMTALRLSSSLLPVVALATFDVLPTREIIERHAGPNQLQDLLALAALAYETGTTFEAVEHELVA